MRRCNLRLHHTLDLYHPGFSVHLNRSKQKGHRKAVESPGTVGKWLCAQAEDELKDPQCSARTQAPSLPASVRPCVAPGSPRARKSCRTSRTQRVSCRCGTGARAPPARAVWKTPEGEWGGREKVAEAGGGVRTLEGHGLGTQG